MPGSNAPICKIGMGIALTSTVEPENVTTSCHFVVSSEGTLYGSQMAEQCRSHRPADTLASALPGRKGRIALPRSPPLHPGSEATGIRLSCRRPGTNEPRHAIMGPQHRDAPIHVRAQSRCESRPRRQPFQHYALVRAPGRGSEPVGKTTPVIVLERRHVSKQESSVVRVPGIVPVARQWIGICALRRANSSVTAVICARTAIFAERRGHPRTPKMAASTPEMDRYSTPTTPCASR